tara:strand:- start:25 stop:1038 length:1014 start_codon:yes stop_codon:yes gene_type:complete
MHAKDNNGDTIGRKVLAFLAGNLLDPTPQNYRFGYYYITGTSKAICKEADYYVESGLRIQQDTVRELLQAYSESADDREDQIAVKDEAVETFMQNAITLSRETRDQAGTMGRDISEENRIIAEGATGETLTQAVARIVRRAEEAERELANSCNRMDRMQRDLEEARNKAYVDELTGIPNRRSAHAKLADLKHDKSRYTIAIVDIDHFKRINDTWGHDVGDRAINHVANHLKNHLEPWMVARWGGEEFLIIADTPNHEKVAAKLEEVKKELAQKKLKIRETDQPMGIISFSSGVALGGDRSSEQAIRKADDLLYMAKRQGRNQVIAESFADEVQALAA